MPWLSPAAFSRLLNEQRQGNAAHRLWCIRQGRLSGEQRLEIDLYIITLATSNDARSEFIDTNDKHGWFDEGKTFGK